MQKLIVFSKRFKTETAAGLIKAAQDCQLDGYDLCIRPDYAINPQNVRQQLPLAVKQLAKEGLQVPMVTGSVRLLTPDDPGVADLLAAMAAADVRLLKLGYFKFDPGQQDYWQEVGRIRKIFEKWEKLARQHEIKICYHTHSNRCFGGNCAALMHLIAERDPEYIGAYIDPGHMLVEGEEFCVGAAMVKRYLSIVALKDVRLERAEENGHGLSRTCWVPAGQGMVNWTAFFAELARLNFAGPFSIHTEFEVAPDAFMRMLKQEVVFYRKMLAKTQGGQA